MDDDFTIKVSLDFNEKDIKKLREDVQNAVSSASKQGSPLNSESLISKKISEIQEEASQSIYKYGINHVKTKAVLSDLGKAEKVKSSYSIQQEREKQEKLKTEYQEKIQESNLNLKRLREDQLSEKSAVSRGSAQRQKMNELFRNVRSISFSSMKSAYGITSLISKLGPIGTALATIGAVGFGVGKAISWAGNKQLSYASAALGGEGYTTGDIAALTSGAVPGINKNIGQNIAQAISDNATTLSSSYVARFANVQARATQAVALYPGGMQAISNLQHIKKTDTEKDIYSKLFEDIRQLMKNNNPNAAISLGAAFGLSRETVLATQHVPDINKAISQTGSSNQWKTFDNLTDAALRQTSAIDHLTGQINKLSAVIVDLTNKASNNPQTLLYRFTHPSMDNNTIAAGNSSKGVR